MRYRIFYYLPIFSKNVKFSEKMPENHFWGIISFEGKEASGDENEYKLFMGNEVSIILSFNNFFEKKQYFWRQWEKILGGHDHFLEGVILRQK